jgi:hypothetical protein
LALTSSETIGALQMFHPLNLSYPYKNFLPDFQLDSNLEFSSDSFKLTFIQSPYLSTSGPSGMVSKHLKNFFHPKD